MGKCVGAFLAGVAVGVILLTAGVLFSYWPRPGPASVPSPMTISPPAPGQTPQVTIRGHASGPAKRAEMSRRPQEARREAWEGNYTPASEIAAPLPEPVAQTAESTEAPPPEPAFYVGERAEGTIAGEIEVVDQRGRKVTTEPLRISGSYTLDFPAPGEAELSLRFDAPAIIRVEEPERAIHLGASAGWLADEPFIALHVGYERRWEITKSLDARVEVEAGWAWTPENAGPYARAEVGIVYRF